MNTQMEILRPLKAIIIKFDIPIKLLIRRLEILGIILPALQHGFGTEIRQVGIIDLAISEAIVVQNLQLGLIGFGQIGKVLIVVGIHAFEVGFVGSVAEMVPGRAGEGEFDVFPLVLGEDALHVF